MLDAAVKFLAEQVNAYLLRRTGRDVVKVVPGRLAEENGTWAVAKDSIGLSLVNIEEERGVRDPSLERTPVGGMLVTRQPALNLNLQVMFAARHNDYEHALHYLSLVLTFFQANPSFSPEKAPTLPPGLVRLSLELLSYGPEQLNQVWAYIGTRYLPSALYRVRLVSLRDAEPSGSDRPITAIDLL